MKREALERHLRQKESRETAPVPRHREIDDRLARAICDQLGIAQP